MENTFDKKQTKFYELNKQFDSQKYTDCERLLRQFIREHEKPLSNGLATAFPRSEVEDLTDCIAFTSSVWKTMVEFDKLHPHVVEFCTNREYMKTRLTWHREAVAKVDKKINDK